MHSTRPTHELGFCSKGMYLYIYVYTHTYSRDRAKWANPRSGALLEIHTGMNILHFAQKVCTDGMRIARFSAHKLCIYSNLLGKLEIHESLGICDSFFFCEFLFPHMCVFFCFFNCVSICKYTVDLAGAGSA